MIFLTFFFFAKIFLEEYFLQNLIPSLLICSTILFLGCFVSSLLVSSSWEFDERQSNLDKLFLLKLVEKNKNVKKSNFFFLQFYNLSKFRLLKDHPQIINEKSLQYWTSIKRQICRSSRNEMTRISSDDSPSYDKEILEIFAAEQKWIYLGFEREE